MALWTPRLQISGLHSCERQNFSFSPGGGLGNRLQCSCLENPMDRGAWWVTIHRVAKSLTWLKQLSTKHASKIYKEFTQLNNKKKKQDFFLKNLLFLAIKCVVICYVSHRKWKGHSMLSVGSEMEELAGQVDTWAPLRREARAGDKALKGSWAYRWQFKPLSAQNLKHSPRSSFSEAQKQKLFRFWGTDFIHCYNQTPTLCINDIQYPYQIICL